MTVISKFDGQYRFLSNFSGVTVWLDGLPYPSVEHAYQAAKTLDLNERKEIRHAQSPSIAKHLGRCVTTRPDWERIKVTVMADLVWQKFQMSHLRAALLATGDSPLIEGNYWHDTFWGVCNGVGENYLGKILMSVREVLQESVA